ncbi:uncharacterized protein K02A2.6-like [Gigantopelta aegis]|uniref:uncharacterized protein K02A2.6-like n=1 Tax=Gigantopelta aegis TaxID=1735272 RepID=UPI001B887BF3|nr:uncharacterized protein K02A2.6-like [Gigantopelta aegis]
MVGQKTILIPPFDLTSIIVCREELSAVDGCILWGARVVIPPPGRKLVLSQLHDTHPGICKMKSLARRMSGGQGWTLISLPLFSTVTLVNNTDRLPKKAPLHPWEWPSRPWSRVHIDHTGPFQGKLFLVLVDAHSKWIEVHIVPSTSAASTIAKLRHIFATFGLPEQIVSDNGSGFTSVEFQQFLAANGIKTKSSHRHTTHCPMD